MNHKFSAQITFYTATLTLSLFLIGCDNMTTPTNTNTGNVAITTNTQNANTENNNSADTSEESSSSEIEAKEPEKYEAKVSLRLEALGENNSAGLPTLTATVARDGNNKRMEFTLPNGQKIVYLETGGKNLVILPAKKQYAELNKASVGFDVRSLMTPEQMIKQAQSIKGLEKAGEEKYNGRDAVKYVYSATTNTNSKAGDVETKSYVYVDKETGLPLKTEIVSQTRGEGNVQGFKGIKIVTEISDIKTDVPADLFKQPEGFEKIEEAQIQSQINLVFQTAQAIIGQLIKSAG